MAYGNRRRNNRKRASTSSRRRKYTSKMYRTNYKKTAKIVKSVMDRNTETKRHNQTWTPLFAGNGATSGTDGHVLANITIPTTGTAQNQRIGNRIRLTGLVFNYRYAQLLGSNINYPLTGRIYLICNREGGTSFPIGNFLDNDPNTSSITYNSIRNPDFYKDFLVLRTQRIRLGQDNYQGNFDMKSGQMRWKGDLPMCINSNVPTTNSLFLLFVADAGYTSGSVNPQNAIDLKGETRLYFKDD